MPPDYSAGLASCRASGKESCSVRDKPLVLWVGDAVVSTGFSCITKNVCTRLKEQFEFHILGISYNGDPAGKLEPWNNFDIYPAFVGKDAMGLGRIRELREKLLPDLIVLLNDPWNVPEYLRRIDATPTIATTAVDGKNCQGRALTGLAHTIFWTKFGLEEARLGGYIGPASVVPLGVDTNVFCPGDRVEARNFLGMPEECLDGFVVLNVNRNQQRKRMDLTLSFFAEWIYTRKIKDAYLYLHVAPTPDDAYDLPHLVAYFDREWPGVKGSKVLRAKPSLGLGVSEEELVQTYRAADLFINTGQGEGFGLTTLEAMACGIACAVPRWSGLGEWATEALYVPCSEISVTPKASINAVGALPDRVAFLDALDFMYSQSTKRAVYARKGLELARKPKFDWDNIAAEYSDIFREVLAR